MVLSVVLIILATGYVAVRKDLFEKTHFYNLISPSGEGLSEGMPLLFSGFQIGEVDQLELNPKGQVSIRVAVSNRHIKWLRKESSFTLEKPLIGAPRIVVVTADINSAPLPKNPPVKITIVDDINEVIRNADRILQEVTQIADNIHRLTGEESDLGQSLGNVRRLTDKLVATDSLLEMATGDSGGSEALNKALRRIDGMAVAIGEVATNLNQITSGANTAILGKGGSLENINTILADVVLKLKDVDVVMDHMKKISADLNSSTSDISQLRGELDEVVSTTNQVVKDLRRLLPSGDEPEIKLP